MFEMTICTPDGKPLRRYDLSRLAKGGRRVVIGRAEDCDIRIKSPAVSRHHCVIETIEDDELIIRDTDSSLGTLVEGQKITETEIEPGLEVHVGPAVLKFDSVTSRIAADIQKELGEG